MIVLAFRMNNSAANELDRRCRSLSSTGRHLGLLDASKSGESTRCTPGLPKGTFSPQFHSLHEIKMAARACYFYNFL